MRPTKNASLVSAGFYSALLTMFGGSWYFLFSIVFAVASGGNIGNVIGDTIGGCILCWVIGTAVFYEIGKMFDDFNEEGRRRRDERERTEGNDRNDNSR